MFRPGRVGLIPPASAAPYRRGPATYSRL